MKLRVPRIELHDDHAALYQSAPDFRDRRTDRVRRARVSRRAAQYYRDAALRPAARGHSQGRRQSTRHRCNGARWERPNEPAESPGGKTVDLYLRKLHMTPLPALGRAHSKSVRAL